jgi:hypothetical protein
MTLNIDAAALAHIRKKGGVCAIRQVAIKACCAEIPQTDISYGTPEKINGYEAFSEGAVTLYLSKSLRFKGDVAEVSLGRLLFMRWLELPTLVGLGGCDLETALP